MYSKKTSMREITILMVSMFWADDISFRAESLDEFLHELQTYNIKLDISEKYINSWEDDNLSSRFIDNYIYNSDEDHRVVLAKKDQYKGTVIHIPCSGPNDKIWLIDDLDAFISEIEEVNIRAKENNVTFIWN